MASPAEQVDKVFTKADQYAKAAESGLKAFTARLEATDFSPAINTNGFKWDDVKPPTIPSSPSLPSLPQITFVSQGTGPAPLTEVLPNVVIETFTDAAPVIAFPSAPTVSYGAVPAVPSVGAISLPAAPALVMPDAPNFLAINAVSFGGVDLHEDWLTRLEDVPTLTLASPTPYSYVAGPEYASSLLDNLKSRLMERMSGGTGLSPAVEQALWDRARSRETTTALANQAEIMRTSEAMGYPLPSGLLAAQMRQAQKDYYDKLSGLSRDIAIKQADLEQENMRQAIAAGMQLEGQLIDYSYKMEAMAFEASKTAAEMALQAYNAAIERFKALLQGYQTYASAYKTIIDGQMAKVEVYKAQLQGEEIKGQINASLVAQYKASIEAGMAQVEIYRAQVSAAQTLVQLEQAKIGAAGEQIRAYVAQVNAETAKVEAYKASVEAEQTKVTVYKVKADAFTAKVGAQAEYARAMVSRYNALVSAKTGEWEGYRARVQAESVRMDALGKQSGAMLDAYRINMTGIQAQAEMHTKQWEVAIKQKEAAAQIGMQAEKMNADIVASADARRLDAVKAGTQVYAQLVASAYSMMKVSAGVDGRSSTSVSYNYAGRVTDIAAGPTVT